MRVMYYCRSCAAIQTCEFGCCWTSLEAPGGMGDDAYCLPAPEGGEAE